MVCLFIIASFIHLFDLLSLNARLSFKANFVVLVDYTIYQTQHEKYLIYITQAYHTYIHTLYIIISNRLIVKRRPKPLFDNRATYSSTSSNIVYIRSYTCRLYLHCIYSLFE